MGEKCVVLQQKLDLLVQTLNNDENFVESIDIERRVLEAESYPSIGDLEKGVLEKPEKDITNLKRVRKDRNFVERDAVMARANSLKRAIRQLVEQTEVFINEQRNNTAVKSSSKMSNTPIISEDTGVSNSPAKEHDFLHLEMAQSESNVFLVPTIISSGCSDISLCPSPTPNLINLSPMPDLRRDSQTDDMLTLPAPDGFADSRRNSSNMPQE